MDAVVRPSYLPFVDANRDFGAVGDNVTDDTAAIQAAINSLGARGGMVYLANRQYVISGTGLTANAGVLLSCNDRNDISNNTNGSGGTPAAPYIRFAGTVGSNMYRIYPSLTGRNVWGGGSRGITWDGGNLAAYGVVLDNTKFAEFSGSVRSVTGSGVWINSASGTAGVFSQNNYINSLEFIYGSGVAVQSANGLRISGNGSTAPSTQQFVGTATGLVYDGAMVRIEETDNCLVNFVAAAVLGAGCSVYLRNTGFGPSDSNVFVKVSGKVYSDTGLYGNEFLHYNSEGGGFYQLAGTSSWDGELLDYTNGRRFKSHVYQLRKKISVSPGMMRADAACGTGDFANQWQTISFPKAGSPRVCVMIPPDYDLANGVIEGIEVYYGSNGTSAGNMYTTLTISCITTGVAGAVLTPGSSTNQAMAIPAQYFPGSATVTLGTPLAYTNGQSIFVALQRISASGFDTNTDPILVCGIRILYRSTGPDGVGCGTYTPIPAWT